MGDWLSTVIGSILGVIFTLLLTVPARIVRNYIRFKNNGIFLNSKKLSEKIDKRKRIKKKLNVIFFDKWDSRYVHIERREKELYSNLEKGNNIRVVSPIARGKTRTTIEVIRKLVKNEVKNKNTKSNYQKAKLVVLNKDCNFKQKTFRRIFIKKWNVIILLFDDIDKIMVKLLNEGTNLKAVINNYKKISNHVQLLCTCQSEEWFLAGKTNIRRDAFLDERDDIEKLFPFKVELSALTRNEWIQLAKTLSIKFDLEKFSGEPGDLIFDTVSKRKKYDNLKSSQKNFLKAVKICFISNTFTPPILLTGKIAKEHFDVGNLWREIFNDLKLADFYKVRKDKIFIPEIFIKKVIWDYPEGKQILIDDLNFMADLFESENMPNRLNSLAATYLKLGNDNKALDILSKAIELNKDNSYYYSNRGYVYERLGDFTNALKDFDKGIELDPSNSDIYNHRGNTYNKSGQIDLAINDYDKAIELDATNADPYNNKAVIFIRTGEWEIALYLCNNAIILDPFNVSTYNNRGIVYSNLQRYDEALNDFNKALELDPYFAKAYINRGKLFDDTGKPDESFADYNKAIRLDKNDPTAYNNRGNIYFRSKMFDEAFKDFSKAIELDVNFAESYNNRAMVYAKRGDSKRAIEDFNRAISIKPNYTVACINRGNEQMKLGLFKDACDSFSKAIELDPENDGAIQNRGTANWGLQEYDKALDDFSNALYLNGENALAFYNRAQLYSDIGKPNEALDDYTRAWALKRQLPQEGGEMPYFVVRLLIIQPEVDYKELRKWFDLAQEFYPFYPDEIKKTIDEALHLLEQHKING